MAKRWIQSETKNTGALHKALGIPANKTIPLSTLEEAAKKKGKIGKMARLAITLRKLSKKKKRGKK